MRQTQRLAWSPAVARWRLAVMACCVVVALLSVNRLLEAQPEGGEFVSAETAVPVPSAPPKGSIPSRPFEVLQALGLFLYPLGATSIIVVWFSIERLVVLRSSRVIPKPFVRRFLEQLEQGQLDSRTAMRLCEENSSPIASIFAHGLRKWGKSSVEVEQAIIDGGERQVSQLRKHLRVLNGASTIAPLIGLLGTVVGMIESFNSLAMTQGPGRTQELAGGIGLALLTTAVGLLIAIPALIIYMYLAGRVDSLVIEMDGLAQHLVDQISAEALAEQRQQSRAPLERTAAASKGAETGKKSASSAGE